MGDGAKVAGLGLGSVFFAEFVAKRGPPRVPGKTEVQRRDFLTGEGGLFSLQVLFAEKNGGYWSVPGARGQQFSVPRMTHEDMDRAGALIMAHAKTVFKGISGARQVKAFEEGGGEFPSGGALDPIQLPDPEEFEEKAIRGIGDDFEKRVFELKVTELVRLGVRGKGFTGLEGLGPIARVPWRSIGATFSPGEPIVSYPTSLDFWVALRRTFIEVNSLAFDSEATAASYADEFAKQFKATVGEVSAALPKAGAAVGLGAAYLVGGVLYGLISELALPLTALGLGYYFFWRRR